VNAIKIVASTVIICYCVVAAGSVEADAAIIVVGIIACNFIVAAI
jgi:hypothetical protein